MRQDINQRHLTEKVAALVQDLEQQGLVSLTLNDIDNSIG
jgi:hypothetical protein